MSASGRSPVRGLTLHRPWAWAILRASKRVENREFAPPAWLVGGWLALHAGVTYDDVGAAWIAKVFGAIPPAAAADPARAIVGLARLVEVVDRATAEERSEGVRRWFGGPFGWVLDEVTPIEPVPCRGMQGLWVVPRGVLAEVRARFLSVRRSVDAHCRVSGVQSPDRVGRDEVGRADAVQP